jgi:hypothetical protein
MTLNHALHVAGRAIVHIAERLAYRPDDFTCADCDRNPHCGLTPSKECIYRLMKISEGRRAAPRPPIGIYPFY